MTLRKYIRCRKRKPKPKPKPSGYISEVSISNKGFSFITNTIKGKIMALALTDNQQAVGTLTFKDKKGATTDVADGAVTVTSSDDAVFTATYDDDSNGVTVVATGIGVASLTIKATNQKGDDIPFEDTAVEVKSDVASQGAVTFAEPTEQS